MFQGEVQVVFLTGIKPQREKRGGQKSCLFFLKKCFLLAGSQLIIKYPLKLILLHTGQVNDIRRYWECVPAVIGRKFIHHSSKFSFRYYIETFLIQPFNIHPSKSPE